MTFNKRMQLIKPGMLHKFLEISSNPDILSLSIGEPDFATPYHIRQAGIDAIEAGKTFYTPSKGLLGLRKEIANFYSRKYNLSYDPATEILTTIGASEGIEMALRCLLNEGDEVIVVGPAYLSYEPLILMAGAQLVTVTLRLQKF
jgi:aminotransferase